ncbi:SYLM-like protein [Mya arenaria]|uniref:leucine--tRNA ligase n=1 Tax=Mya arenaria TaxID=6604 RepID=A0ABY7EQV0_MYAAR|nr:SYLM-like protein [Mya arenaria]
MLGQLTVTWNVLKHCRIFLQQLRGLASLYEQNGKWVPQLKNNTMLDIENAWKTQLQQYDRSEQSRLKNNGNEKFYVLSMFPYPSGKLHMGHVRVYTISDMMARYHRMLGHQVVHPMGFDAFGLPAENAAIERNLHPKEWTYSNISVMKRQLGNLCCNFDWDREVTTCDPGYYRWTQYIFLRMYEAGLVYQRQASVNWDPVDETVLADEQIDDEGQAWRSGALAERRYLKQWYIQTTAYAKGGDAEDVLSIFTETPEAVYGISHIVLPTSHRYNQLQYYKHFDGLTRQETREAVMALAREGGFGGHPVSSHLRDWLISRQRYWGTPIPIIHCPECKAVPVPYEDLPVELPESTTTGHNALKKNTDWLNVTCPKCGGPAKRETDTMDTFVDSSWYFLRYLNKSNLDLPISKERADAYMPVDLYIGGKEHVYIGVQKWLHRVWTLVGVLVEPVAKQPVSHDLVSQWDKKIKEFRNKYLLEKVPDDVAVISEEYKRAVRDLVIMITPAAPMISMECWAALQHTGIAEKVNKRHTIGKLPLSHKAFRALSEQNVIYILGHEDFFLNTVKNNEIVHTQLVVKPNLSAQVNLSIPSLEFELENKTKGKKKGGKKGKQQHQDSESADVKQYR